MNGGDDAKRTAAFLTYRIINIHPIIVVVDYEEHEGPEEKKLPKYF